MAGNSRKSYESDSTTGHTAPNFSRPKPAASALKSGQKDYQNRQVRIVDAYHEPNRRSYPGEPRFSGESERTDNTSSENSASSDFAWDGHAGEMDSRRRKQRFDDQRSAPPERRSSTKTDLSTSESEGGSSATQAGHIIKRVSVDQRSERIPYPAGQAEDSASQRTGSESGESVGSFDSEGNWQSSDYDTSALSPAQIRKLEKKGINPALYMEMQAAKKGKKWVPQLLGNGFLN